jgi:putative membrane protein
MKLDPLSIPYRAGESVVRLAWLLVILAIGSDAFAGASGLGLLVVAWFVAMLGYQLVYYQRFEYELTEDTLDIASGVVSRRNREIPIRRIQNVDISRNVVQRALGLAQINLETAGGSSTEASLKYVSFDEAQRLQSEIGDRKRGDTRAETIEPAAERELFAITPKELVLLGVVGIDLRLLSFVTVLLPVISPSLRERFADPLLGLAVTAPLAAAAVVAVTAAISGLIAVTNYYGFRLTRRSEELQYERGLLQRFSGTIPLEKVQTLAVSENVIARRLGYASLAVETAGYAPGDAGSESAIPLAERDRVVRLAQSIEPFDDVDYDRPPKRARERYIVRYVALAVVLAGLALAVDRFTGFSFAWYVTLALVVIAPVAAHLKWLNLGYDVQPEYVVLRDGFWTRTTTVIPYYRVQTVLDSQTVFQRRRQLATLVVDTAGSSGLTGGQPRALDINAELAAELREEIAERLQIALVQRRGQRRRERLRSIEPQSDEGIASTPSTGYPKT